jgi:hypothetical protein
VHAVEVTGNVPFWNTGLAKDTTAKVDSLFDIPVGG